MKKTLVAFLWHMHQPDYRLPGESRHLLPWVRLHATKAYYDMPWLLEQAPHVKACINFSGSLLRQLRAYINDGARDVWWELSERPIEDLKPDERHFLLEHFFSINWDRQIKPVKGYWRLLNKRGFDPADIDQSRFSDRELRDLQVYFNLAWMGFAARRQFPLVGALLDKAGGYSEEDKHGLLALQIEIMGRLLPMYRGLVERGQVELTTTPMYHPIMPLLVDTDAARRATPERPSPRRFAWPGDARWHVGAAIEQFEQTFGHKPSGMWPSEGSVSPEVMPIFAEAGLSWVASDEDVLMASYPRPNLREDALYRPYTLDTAHGRVSIVFRDHILSDLIGFTYASNPPQAAVDDLLRRVREGGQAATATGQPLVSIILDGENPWESYPDDGEPFLRALYEALGKDEALETVLLKDAVSRVGHGPLHHLHSGSWIRANFQIWIGADETNTAWNLLGETRAWLERERSSKNLADDDEALTEAMEAMHAAQGSDWFWWYGDDFSSAQDKVFDSLFRAYLRAVYAAFGAPPPAALHRSLSSRQAQVEIIAPRALIHPDIDGLVANYFEWAGAGRYEPHGGAGSMYRARRYIKVIYFGFDLERLYLRFDPDVDFLTEGGEDMSVRLLFQSNGADEPQYIAEAPLTSDPTWTLTPLSDRSQARLIPRDGTLAFERLFEMSIPFEWLSIEAGDTCRFSLALIRRGIEIDRHPPHGHITYTVPDESFETQHWLV